MGFWSDAFEDLSDNAAIVWAAVGDINDNLNPLSDQFLSGEARRTATEVEEQLAREQGREVDPRRIAVSSSGGLERIAEAGTQTGKDVGHAVASTLESGGKLAGGALDLLSNKWVLGGLAVVVVLAVAAPYIAPAVARATT